jgi:diguanylate cyclase (GGDEF)-like protein
VRYAKLTTALAGTALTAFCLSTGWRIDSPALFSLLTLFVIAGELLPIPVPWRRGATVVTVSSAFAFAILLRFGPVVATVVYGVSVVIADSVARRAPIKILFNASQYVLAMLAAAAVLKATGTPPGARLTTGEVPAVLAAGTAFFAANHLLACGAAAVLAGIPISRYMWDDVPFQIWTAGCLLALAPSVVASADASIALVPVCFVPMVAIYVGGCQAAINCHRAYHDSLTDLPNRAALTESLNGALAAAERERRPVAVLLLDLDDFKAINDTMGHECGDQVLKEVAQRLKRGLDQDETLARLGGDEFAAIIHGGVSKAEAAARRLLEALDHTMEIDSLLLHSAGTIGISVFPQHGRSVRELLRLADVALYTAKDANAAFRTYAGEYDDTSVDRLALAAQLRRGIERGELAVHYQPKAPLRDGGTFAVEALARWNHPQLGCIGPDGFIPLAEQTGAIKPLTERIFESALRQCQLWWHQGLHVKVAVNVSTRSLLDHDLPPMIRTLLRRFGLPAAALELEITESRIVADLPRARSALDEIRTMGVNIAIDDFGTGFSSLSQLQQLPIDEIKIDRSFVMRMEADENDAILVRSIIDLARNLGLRVTAEGVESKSILSTLERLGCDYAQGFHIGRPAVAEECRRLLVEARPVKLAAVSSAA